MLKKERMYVAQQKQFGEGYRILKKNIVSGSLLRDYTAR